MKFKQTSKVILLFFLLHHSFLFIGCKAQIGTISNLTCPIVNTRPNFSSDAFSKLNNPSENEVLSKDDMHDIGKTSNYSSKGKDKISNKVIDEVWTKNASVYDIVLA